MLERQPMKRAPGTRREWERQVRTVCQECSVGCGLVASVIGGRVVDVQGDEEHAVSRGRLCARGTAFVQGLVAPERLTAPALRKRPGAAPSPLDDWKGAVDLLAERLRQVKERHGPEALLIACDQEGGLDFHLGALRFAHLWGTPRVFHAGGEPLDPWPEGLDAPAASCSEWARSECLVLVEADLAAMQPVAFALVQEAQRRGAKVVAADARFTSTLAKADVALRLKPGSGNLLGVALAKLVAAERPPGDGALADLAGADAWRASLERLSLGDAEAALGVAPDDLRRVAALVARHDAVTVITGRALAALPHHRVWLTLAKAMGWVGRRGGGWYALDAGTPPLSVQGDPDERLAPARAPHAVDDVAPRGDVRAVICSGDALTEVEPLGAFGDGVELVAHFGAFPSATWERATITFPAALWAEREGLFFGGDRSVDWADAIVPPPAGCRSGLEFWIELARRFGWQDRFPWAGEDGRADHGAFWGWLRDRSPALTGVSLERVRDLEAGARCFWPAGDAAHPAALRPGTVAAHPAPASLAVDGGAAGYPLALVAAHTGARSGDASRFWPWTRALAREDAVQIHPETARRLGIESGDEVLVETPRGALPGRAALTRVVSTTTLGSFRRVAGVPALLRRKDQSPDEARALLAGARP